MYPIPDEKLLEFGKTVSSGDFDSFMVSLKIFWFLDVVYRSCSLVAAQKLGFTNLSMSPPLFKNPVMMSYNFLCPLRARF